MIKYESGSSTLQYTAPQPEKELISIFNMLNFPSSQIRGNTLQIKVDFLTENFSLSSEHLFKRDECPKDVC